jgi:hypothetical protein
LQRPIWGQVNLSFIPYCLIICKTVIYTDQSDIILGAKFDTMKEIPLYDVAFIWRPMIG